MPVSSDSDTAPAHFAPAPRKADQVRIKLPGSDPYYISQAEMDAAIRTAMTNIGTRRDDFMLCSNVSFGKHGQLLHDYFLDITFKGHSRSDSQTISVWRGDFESIMRKIPANDQGVFDGLAGYYHLGQPWKENEGKPWEVEQIPATMRQLTYAIEYMKADTRNPELMEKNENYPLLGTICAHIYTMLYRAGAGQGKVYITYKYRRKPKGWYAPLSFGIVFIATPITSLGEHGISLETLFASSLLIIPGILLILLAIRRISELSRQTQMLPPIDLQRWQPTPQHPIYPPPGQNYTNY